MQKKEKQFFFFFFFLNFALEDPLRQKFEYETARQLTEEETGRDITQAIIVPFAQLFFSSAVLGKPVISPTSSANSIFPKVNIQ